MIFKEAWPVEAVGHTQEGLFCKCSRLLLRRMFEDTTGLGASCTSPLLFLCDR